MHEYAHHVLSDIAAATRTMMFALHFVHLNLAGSYFDLTDRTTSVANPQLKCR